MAFNEPTGSDKKVQDHIKESGEIPRHIAIIMDGNGRWAQEKNRPRTFGHREGVHSVRDIVEACGQIGVYTHFQLKTGADPKPRSRF